MGKEPQLYRLKLKSLAYVSSVDTPAQETAVARLLKRGTGLQVATTARVAKLSDELGLVFGWALTTKANGEDYFDLQGDNVLEDDLIKIAAEWMSAGGAADTMHDREQDGRAVFAMPMTTEVAKAVYGDKIGGELGTYGLLVAIRPSAEDFAKFKTGELTGFSIDGTGERSATKARTRKGDDKRYLTDEQLGHQHEAHAYDGGEPWMTDATAEGAQAPHRHIVIRQPDGSLSVLADSGHTHTLTEQPKVVVVSDDTAVVSEAVAARAPGESPQAKKSPNVNITNPSTRKNAMDPAQELTDLKALKEKLDAKIAELEAANTELKATAELSDADKAHLATLTASEQKRFRSLEKAARAAEVAKALEADPVVATIDGVEYRKSTPGAQLAKMLADQREESEVAKVNDIAKSTIGHYPGDAAVHRAIVKAVRNSGESTETITKMFESLRGPNAVMAAKAKAPGFDSQIESPSEPQAQLDTLIAAEMTAKSVDKVAATTSVMKTAKGIDLYTAIQVAKKARA